MVSIVWVNIHVVHYIGLFLSQFQIKHMTALRPKLISSRTIVESDGFMMMVLSWKTEQIRTDKQITQKRMGYTPLYSWESSSHSSGSDTLRWLTESMKWKNDAYYTERMSRSMMHKSLHRTLLRVEEINVYTEKVSKICVETWLLNRKLSIFSCTRVEVY